MITDGPFAGYGLKGLRAYRSILVDPPWKFQVRSAKGEGRSAERHYKTMTIPEIKALPVQTLAAQDAWLFLWVTTPMAAEGRHVEIMRAWGARPSALAFNWIKINEAEDGFHFGMGYTTRKNSELCFLGRWGSPKRRSKSVSEIILSPVREHSRKPAVIHKRIMQYCQGPYIELFARETPPDGFHYWGDDVRHFPMARDSA